MEEKITEKVIKKNDIRKLSFEELKTFMVSEGEKAFRAKQIYEWLWKKSVTSFDEMTNLSLENREFLAKHFEIKAVQLAEKQISIDETIKSSFQLFDKNLVEGVLIP